MAIEVNSVVVVRWFLARLCIVKTRDGTADKERNRNIWCRRERTETESSLC